MFYFGYILVILPISFRVTSLVLGQSYDCPTASEEILKNIFKGILYWNKSFRFWFTELHFWGSNWPEVGIGSGDGLVLNRQQAITWINDDTTNDLRIYVSPSLGGLTNMVDNILF